MNWVLFISVLSTREFKLLFVLQEALLNVFSQFIENTSLIRKVCLMTKSLPGNDFSNINFSFWHCLLKDLKLFGKNVKKSLNCFLFFSKYNFTAEI